MPACTLGDTSLQRALHGITGQIVCTVTETHTQKGRGLPKANLRERLQILAVHKTMLSEMRIERTERRCGFAEGAAGQPPDSYIDDPVGLARVG